MVDCQKNKYYGRYNVILSEDKFEKIIEIINLIALKVRVLLVSRLKQTHFNK